MNWETLDADVNMILSKHFTKGRSGKKVNKVIVHYNAGNLSISGCYSVWQTREASAHYQVEDGGRIGQLVWDRDTAWHAGNWNANCTSIGIEHANRSDGTISDACLDAGAHLVAACCKYFGLGRPEWLKNVFPHKYFSATSCPGQIYGSQKSAYIKRAQAWYDSMTGSGSAPSGGTSSGSSSSGSSGKKSVSEVAKEVIAGSWGNGSDRKSRLEAAGYNYDKVQAEVNRQLGASSGSSSSSSSNKKSVSQVAKEVIAGSWGNGDTRKRKLEAAGYNYNAVQAEVNRQLGVSSGSSSSSSSSNIDRLARDVIAGKYGNGDARKKALGSNYNAVQKRVNEILAGGGSSTSSKKSIDTIAKEVIQGKWGNGNTRKKKLEAAGYDYNAVQKRVNQLL